jgi:hypothetical protein
MRFSTVVVVHTAPRGAVRYAPLCVQLVSHRLQVRRSDTAFVLAEVVEFQTLGDGTDEEFV